MADYIDREKLYENEIPYINQHYTGVSEKPYEAMPVYSMRQIERQPSADVVEVVRCKDCKYNDEGSCIRVMRSVQWRYVPQYVENTDYCKWGEKE